jgi:hypothetical protein
MRLILFVALAMLVPRIAEAAQSSCGGELACADTFCTGEVAAVIDATVIAAEPYDQPNRRVVLDVVEVVPDGALPLGEIEVAADVYSVGPGFVGARTVLFAREEAGILVLTTAVIDYDLDQCFGGQRVLGSIAAIVQSDTCAAQLDAMEAVPATSKMLMCCGCSSDVDPVGGLVPIALLLGLRRAAAGLLRPRRAAASGGGSTGPSADRASPCCDRRGPSD